MSDKSPPLLSFFVFLIGSFIEFDMFYLLDSSCGHIIFVPQIIATEWFPGTTIRFWIIATIRQTFGPWWGCRQLLTQGHADDCLRAFGRCQDSASDVCDRLRIARYRCQKVNPPTQALSCVVVSCINLSVPERCHFLVVTSSLSCNRLQAITCIHRA